MAGWSKFFNGWMRVQLTHGLAEITYANRPTSPVVGELINFSDSNTATWGATVAGSGANKILARYNGTNWTVVGK